MQENRVMPDRLNLFQRIRYSIFPGTLQKPTYYERYRNFFNSLIFHFRPRSVQERTLRFTLTWGLGGMAVVLVCILFGTGLMLKFVYQPVPDRAYASIVHLQNNVAFGELVRNMHHWGGNTLLIIVFLHFLRVFFTGAFHPPRQFNWIIGLAMFLAVLGPVGLLGHYHLHRHAGIYPRNRPMAAKSDPRRQRYWTGHVIHFFCHPHSSYSRQPSYSDALSFLAGA